MTPSEAFLARVAEARRRREEAEKERAFLIARADSFLEHGKQYDQDEWVGPNVARTLYRIIGELRDALEAAPL